jgi:hypothetical protein
MILVLAGNQAGNQRTHICNYAVQFSTAIHIISAYTVQIKYYNRQFTGMQKDQKE